MRHNCHNSCLSLCILVAVTVYTPVGTSCTRDIPEEKWIPKTLVATTVPKPAAKRAQQPAAKPAAASSSIPVADGKHVQQFETLWDRERSFTLLLFSSRGSQKTDGWLQCVEQSACVCHVPHTISMYACQRVSKSLWQPTASQRLAMNYKQYGRISVLVCGGVQPPPPPRGNRHLATMSSSCFTSWLTDLDAGGSGFHALCILGYGLDAAASMGAPLAPCQVAGGCRGRLRLLGTVGPPWGGGMSKGAAGGT